MTENFTLNQLAEFTRNEHKLLESIGLQASFDRVISPSKSVVTNLLNYSKSLSVRKSRIMGQINNVLN